MVTIKERNREYNIISDDIMIAFAYAHYKAYNKDIYINGIKHHIHNCSYTYNGKYYKYGFCLTNLVNGEKYHSDSYELASIRKSNPINHHYFCFNDEAFLSTN